MLVAGCAAPSALPPAATPTGPDLTACAQLRTVIQSAAAALPTLVSDPVGAAARFRDFAASARAAAGGASDRFGEAAASVAQAYQSLSQAAATGSLPRTETLRSAVSAFTGVCGLSDDGVQP